MFSFVDYTYATYDFLQKIATKMVTNPLLPHGTNNAFWKIEIKW
jgi:hypothetical protein